MKSILATVCASVILFIPFLLFPQDSSAQGLVPCEGPECQACHVVELGQNIIEFLVMIASFIAVLLFAFAGFLMLTAAGNTGQVEKAKGVFTNVLVGLLIVLMGWLIVDTVMKYTFQGLPGETGSDLYESTKADFGPWNQINCVDQPVYVREGSGGGALATGAAREDGTVREGSYTHAEAWELLSDAGISLSSSGSCIDPNQTTCTALAGIQKDVVNQVLEIKKACLGCNITVTGGTEAGHAAGALSHGEGYKIDIDDNQQLDDYLEENLINAGKREGTHGGDRYIDNCGNEYVREKNPTHWDITVNNGSCPL